MILVPADPGKNTSIATGKKLNSQDIGVTVPWPLATSGSKSEKGDYLTFLKTAPKAGQFFYYITVPAMQKKRDYSGINPRTPIRTRETGENGSHFTNGVVTPVPEREDFFNDIIS
jgi:hypothetical protein